MTTQCYMRYFFFLTHGIDSKHGYTISDDGLLSISVGFEAEMFVDWKNARAWWIYLVYMFVYDFTEVALILREVLVRLIAIIGVTFN